MIFLKLGGSLITDKTQENSVRWEVLKRLAREIAQWRNDQLAQSTDGQIPPLLIGHGSGSFGHAAAKKYGTRVGVRDAAGWRGFAEVSVAALRLNRIVADALHEAGVPVVSVSPSASVLCADGAIQRMDTTLIEVCLRQGIVPLVMGDVAVDSVRGGTIVSTEEVFAHLAQCLPVRRVLLAGETEGVYERFDAHDPNTSPVVARITPQTWETIRAGIGGSRGADVTGGMAAKVRDMLSLVQAHTQANLSVQIFSGLVDGAVRRALGGEALGTLIGA